MYLELAEIEVLDKHPEKALKYLEQAKAFFDSEVLAGHYMQAYFDLQRYPEAEVQAKLFLQAHPPLYKLLREKRISAYFILASIYASDPANYKRGIQALTEAVNQEDLIPGEKRFLHEKLAQLHFLAGSYQGAEEHALVAAEEKVINENYRLIGFISVHQHKFDRAIEILQRVLAVNPQDEDALLYLGEAYYKKDPTQATKVLVVYARALELDPAHAAHIAKIVPPELMNSLMEKKPASAPEVISDAVAKSLADPEPDAKEAPEPAKTAAQAAGAGAGAAPSAPPKKAKPLALSPEQIIHRQFQAEKKRLQALAVEEAAAAEDHWDVPGLGEVDVDDEKVVMFLWQVILPIFICMLCCRLSCENNTRQLSSTNGKSFSVRARSREVSTANKPSVF